MTAPQQPDEDRERARRRQTMDYPVTLDRLPDALRGDSDDEPGVDADRDSD